MKKGILVLSILGLLLLPASAFGLGLEIAIGGWSQDPSGDLSYKGLTGNDTISIENDLKYGSEFKFTGRAKIDMPLFIPNIYLMATPMSFEGVGRKTVDFTFGDFNFTQNVDFTSEITLTHYDIGFYYGIPFVQTATAKMLNVDVGIDIRILDFDAQIRQTTLGINESKSLTVPIPLLYLAAQVKPLKWLAIEAEIRGLMIGNNKYYSLIGRLKTKVFGPVFVAGGYRYDRIDIDESDVRLDATVDGLFFEAGCEF